MTQPARLTLTTLSEQEFAQIALRHAESELARRGGAMDPAARDRLAAQAAQVLRFARDGDVSGDVPTSELLESFAVRLFGVPAGRVQVGESSAPSTVVVAARTRAALCREDGGVADVPSSGIAALAGVDASYVRRIARAGGLRRSEDGLYCGIDVRNWLARRGLAGFQPTEVP